MPPLNLLTDGVNYSDRKLILREKQDNIEEVAIAYGELIEVFVDFIIVAFTIFVVIKFINRFKSKSEDPKNREVATPKNLELLANLEDLMKEQNNLLRSIKEK